MVIPDRQGGTSDVRAGHADLFVCCRRLLRRSRHPKLVGVRGQPGDRFLDCVDGAAWVVWGNEMFTRLVHE